MHQEQFDAKITEIPSLYSMNSLKKGGNSCFFKGSHFKDFCCEGHGEAHRQCRAGLRGEGEGGRTGRRVEPVQADQVHADGAGLLSELLTRVRRMAAVSGAVFRIDDLVFFRNTLTIFDFGCLSKGSAP